jgi:hypothetical protein
MVSAKPAQPSLQTTARLRIKHLRLGLVQQAEIYTHEADQNRLAEAAMHLLDEVGTNPAQTRSHFLVRGTYGGKLNSIKRIFRQWCPGAE